MRKSLYLKDDDYRLSFLYGNFTTLTRFTELDAERILTERLGPLFVSIHSTNPELRAAHAAQSQGGDQPALAQRPAGRRALRSTARSWSAPASTTASTLEDTLAGILDQYPTLASVGVVPLGISQFSNEAEMRPHTTEEAAFVVDTVAEWQKIFQPHPRAAPGLRGRRVLPAGRATVSRRPRPTTNSHNTRTGSAWPAPSSTVSPGPTRGGPGGVRHGFFASVDAAPAEGYRALRLLCQHHRRRRRRSGPRPPARWSCSPAPTAPASWARCWPSIPRDDVTVREIPNDFFGGNIGVAGLLTGEDIARTLAESPEGPRYLIA